MAESNYAESGAVVNKADYPSRPPFFALKYLRLLIQCEVPTRLGQDVFCLLAAVVLREDALHYRQPPSMFTSDLMGTLGFKKWERLEATRERAGEWIHYAPPPKGSRRAGIYWVKVPAWVDAGRTVDTPDNTPQRDIDDCPPPSNGDREGDCGGHCEGDRRGYLLTPIPVPVPKPKKESTRFVPPSLDEVRAYCEERGNQVDPESWIAHYESNGWKVGRNPMKDWHAAVRTWEKNNFTTNRSKANGQANSSSRLADRYRRERGE